MLNEIFFMHLVAGGITLYMLLIGLRWFGAYIEFDLAAPNRRWVARITDPPLELARKAIGQTMGPFDWAPVVVMLALWIFRLLLTGV